MWEWRTTVYLSHTGLSGEPSSFQHYVKKVRYKILRGKKHTLFQAKEIKLHFLSCRTDCCLRQCHEQFTLTYQRALKLRLGTERCHPVADPHRGNPLANEFGVKGHGLEVKIESDEEESTLHVLHEVCSPSLFFFFLLLFCC